MPGGDHTGPLGAGPGTGRRMGYCAGYDQPGFAGRGRFAGRRHRHWFNAPGQPFWGRSAWPGRAYPDDELQSLTHYADGLKRELEGIQQRIEELSAQHSNKEGD